MGGLALLPAAGKVVGSIFAKKAVDKIVDKKEPAVAPTKPPLPMPDEEELKRKARREAAKRQSSRALTVLSSPGDGETLGP